MSMAPRFWIATGFLTITSCLAVAFPPGDRSGHNNRAASRGVMRGNRAAERAARQNQSPLRNPFTKNTIGHMVGMNETGYLGDGLEALVKVGFASELRAAQT